MPQYEEWELAFIYINDANNDGDIMDKGEFYPSTFASGADAKYNQTSISSDYDGDGDKEKTSQVAVYSDNSGGKTAAVKSKSPNALGLYDMSGNAWEMPYIFELKKDNGSYYRIERWLGGSYDEPSLYMTLDQGNWVLFTYYKIQTLSFRIARTE